MRQNMTSHVVDKVDPAVDAIEGSWVNLLAQVKEGWMIYEAVTGAKASNDDNFSYIKG